MFIFVFFMHFFPGSIYIESLGYDSISFVIVILPFAALMYWIMNYLNCEVIICVSTNKDRESGIGQKTFLTQYKYTCIHIHNRHIYTLNMFLMPSSNCIIYIYIYNYIHIYIRSIWILGTTSCHNQAWCFQMII